MDAVITAGGIPSEKDPLYPYTQGKPKAMVDIAGKPMIQWILDAVGNSKDVEHVVLIGLDKSSGVTCSKPMEYIENQGHMLSNAIAGVHKVKEMNPKAEYVLLISSDIPALTSEMVDWCVEASMETQDELYYGIIPQAVMEKRYPGSKRSFTKLKGETFCGADIHVIHVKLADEHYETWKRLIDNRKNVFKQAAVFGYWTLFLLATRMIDANDAVERVSKKIKIKGRDVRWPYAEAGMDVDKPHQLEQMRADMEKLHPVK
jgi:GTP:adenosylcobinamide-phosphate guanylyltransferase